MKKVLSFVSALALLFNSFSFIFALPVSAQTPGKYINFVEPSTGVYGGETDILNLKVEAEYPPSGIGRIRFRYAPPGETCQQQYTPPYFHDLNDADNDGSNIYTGSWDIAGLPDGEYTICALMHKNGISEGFVTENLAQVSVTIDNTAPESPIDLGFNVPPGDYSEPRPGVDIACGGYTNQNQISHHWTDTSASGATEYIRQWQYPGSGVWSGAEPWVTPYTNYRSFGGGSGSEGLWNVRVQAKDTAGNFSEFSDGCSVTYDVTPPVVEITSPTATVLSGNVPIIGSVTDDNPHHYWLVIENSGGTVVAGPGVVNDATSFTDKHFFDWDTSLIPGGTYTIKLEARDAANNKDPDLSVEWLEVTVDNTSPSIPEITLPANNAVLKTVDLPKIDWNDSVDDSLPIEYQYQAFSDPDYLINRYGPTDWFLASEIPTPGTPEGVYYVRVRARDALGNVSEWSNGAGNPYKITVDNTAPLTIFNSPSDNGFWNSLIPVQGQSTDNVEVASIDISYQEVTEEDIWHLLTTIDNLFNNEPFNWSFDWTPLSENIFNLKAFATDLAGNVETTAYVNSITYDVTPPYNGSLIINGGAEHTNDLNVTLAISAEDNLSGVAEMRIANESSYDDWEPYAISKDWQFAAGTSDGVKTVRVKFKDTAGNANSSYLASDTIILDRVNPTVVWSSPLDGDIVNGEVLLAVNASDGLSGVDRVEFFVNSSPLGVDADDSDGWGIPWDTTVLPLGDYELKAVVYDNAGNFAEEIIQVGVAAVIISPQGVGFDTDEARITWLTDRPTTSRVVYQVYPHPDVLGDPPNYGYDYSTPTYDVGGVTEHIVIISGLTAGTQYAFRVVSAGSPAAVSDGYSFETLTNAGAPATPYTPPQTPLVLGASTTSSVLAYSTDSQPEISDEAVESEPEEEVLGATPTPTPAPEEEVEADGLFASSSIMRILRWVGLGLGLLVVLYFIWGFFRRKKQNK
jgi:hypothetical protein